MLKEALKNYAVDNCFKFGDSVKIENGPFKNKIGKVDGVSENHIILLLNTLKIKFHHQKLSKKTLTHKNLNCHHHNMEGLKSIMD